MKSFSNTRGVLRNYVDISKPWLVENAEVFQALNSSLEALKAARELEERAEDEEETPAGHVTDSDHMTDADQREMAETFKFAQPGDNAGIAEDYEEEPPITFTLANVIAQEIKLEAKKEAEEILAEANKKAAMVLAEAEASAREIGAKAKTETERLHAEALEKAKTEIYPKAREEGYEAGRQVGEKEGKLAFQNAEQLLRLARRALQEEFSKVDEDLLRLSIKIAERLVRCSLFLEPRLLQKIIHALTLLPQERQGWVLHVAAEDAVWLEKEQPPCPCPWVIDDSLNAGDCFLECQEGYFDARLEAQLDKIEHALRKELQHGSMDPTTGNSGTN